ncbi:MAG: hypothetical protein IKE25_07955 [Clostridia bacterium]|nr:hypothetical protein [Clostridia bacterium]
MKTDRLEIMAIIQEEKEREIAAGDIPPLDAAGIKLAENKRFSFDLPINIAKTDPLR